MSSYHIQDLRLVLPALDFDLRINKHCAKNNALFREWFQDTLLVDATRAEELSGHRFDLLCSLCFPTIDPPQLLRVSKLCALTFLANDGHIHAETSPPQWFAGGSTPDYNLLNPEHFLQVAHSMRTRQSREPGRSQPAASDVNIILRFTGNLLSSFYSSREANDQSSHPGLLEFLSVLENAYDRELSEGLVSVTPLAIMWGHTANILMWSQDLVSYTSRHPQKCGLCTVCHSLKGRGLTLQAVVNDIRCNVQSEVGKFIHDFKPLTARPGENEDAIMVANAMRDCIAGFIHWVYESERYFGKRYEEVAKFGWVFMDTTAMNAGGNEADPSQRDS